MIEISRFCNSLDDFQRAQQPRQYGEVNTIQRLRQCYLLGT